MAGSHGGKRVGAGRRLGSIGVARTTVVANRIVERIKAHPELDTPLDFLWRVACDSTVELPIRVQCARDVAPYLFPKLAAVAVTSADSNKLVIEFRDYARPIITDTKALATDLAVEAVIDELHQEDSTGDDDAEE